MVKLFKNLLLANYSFAKRWANKKTPNKVHEATVYIFLTILTFTTVSIFVIIIASLPFKIIFPELFLMLIALIIGIGFQKSVNKAINKWQIEKHYKLLSAKEKTNKNTLTFILFWLSFFIFMYISIKFLGGYSVR